MTSCKTMTKNFPIGTFWLDGLHILIHPCFRRLFSSGQNLSLPVFKEYSWSIKVRKNFHFGHRKCNYWKWGKETCVTFGGRFVNDTNTNQHWVWSCTSFLYQVNFACFYQHTSCYILVPLLVFFTFPPHKMVFHYEVRRLETPSWSCPRAGRARMLCSSSWVSMFPCSLCFPVFVC